MVHGDAPVAAVKEQDAALVLRLRLRYRGERACQGVPSGTDWLAKRASWAIIRYSPMSRSIGAGLPMASAAALSAANGTRHGTLLY